MNPEKLDRLRERYGSLGENEFLDPRFRRVAEALARVRKPNALPYGGIPTLLDAPAATSADGLDVALIGVPTDLGVTNRSGPRFGPRALRTVERIGPYHHQLDVVPLAELRCGDLGDVPFRSRFDLEQTIEDIEAFYLGVVEAGAKPLSVGGDHSMTYPILRAVGAKEPVGMVQIDAHCDTGGEEEGSKFHHGGPFRHAVLDGVLDPDRTVQIGIRGSAEYLWEFSYESGMTVIHAEEFAALGVEAVIERCRGVLGDQPFYLSFDIDGLDPAFAPGTGTPEVGGLSPREAQALLRGLKGLDLVGADVVEVSPPYDPSTTTARIGAQMLFELLALFPFAPSRRATASNPG